MAKDTTKQQGNPPTKYKRGQNPNSRKNLEMGKWKPGESGNGNGRTPGTRTISTCLKEILEQIAPQSVIDSKFVKEFCKQNKKATNADAAAARILYEGLIKGESWALKELSDRTEGKATQLMDVTSNGETLATFQITTKPTE